MSNKIDVYTYKFSDVVMIAHKIQNREKTVWYIDCPECGGQHLFRKLGRKVWTAHCVLSDLEWTITPAEYYLKKPADFTLILGEP